LATLESLSDAELTSLARNAAIGTLAADLAHDFGNSVFAVLGLVDLLLAEDVEPEERLLLIRQTGLGLKTSLHLLTEFMRSEPEPRRAPLDDVVRAALQLLRHGVGRYVEVVEKYPDAQLFVACSPDAVRNAVLQVVTSAREAAGERGRVDVVVALDPPAAALLRVSPAGRDGLGLVVAARIAAEHGGSFERGADGMVLRFPVA
jgi:two-component system, NtrC family, sensor kinase